MQKFNACMVQASPSKTTFCPTPHHQLRPPFVLSWAWPGTLRKRTNPCPLPFSGDPAIQLTSTRSPSRKSFSPFFTDPLSERLDPDSLPVFMALFRTLSRRGMTRVERGGVAVPECSDKFWAVKESTEGASLPEPSATGCRVSLEGRVKIPCSGWHSK